MNASADKGRFGQPPPTLSSIEDLTRLAEKVDVSIHASADVSILANPVKIGRLAAPNSLAIHPMEACDGDALGRPGKLTLRRYRRFAEGGAGLIWAEAIAVVPEGRANPRQLWLNEESKGSFAEMIVMMRRVAAESSGADHRPIIVAQLTHSGRYSKPEGEAHPLIIQRDPYRDAMTLEHVPDPTLPSRIPEDWPILTDDYLDKLQDAYVEAAKTAFETGFDGVDIKACHGYLINETLAARARAGKYGGSFENRTRFLVEVVERIASELPAGKLIATRLGVHDAIPYPHGWAVAEDDYTTADLTEPKKLIALLEEKGVGLINVTAGSPHYNPHVNRPFNKPISGGYEEPEHPLAGVARLLGLNAEIQKGFPDIATVGTGYSWLQALMPNVAAAVKRDGGAIRILPKTSWTREPSIRKESA
jgi:2,4-dienoyl-CoA reductase-like NADH-dependent reductase (Old Yellow Enzyme family)